jgi:hypothetical protein
MVTTFVNFMCLSLLLAVGRAARGDGSRVANCESAVLPLRLPGDEADSSRTTG